MRFFGKQPKEPVDFGKITPPWEPGRKSIYLHVLAHIGPDGELTDSGSVLPDEEILFKENELRWVAGGLDGTFGHHGGGGADEAIAKKLCTLLRDLLNEPSSRTVKAFYMKVLEQKTLAFIDPFLEFLARENLISDASLYSLSKWILKNAPDREAVKTAIAILGTCANADDCDLFLQIGKHEEFTLFSTVAMTHSLADPEEALWELGKCVKGWGRIHVIETLSRTQNPEIQNWMLREGYKNSLMYEYTAYTCATTGKLYNALCQPNPDEALINATCSMLEFMVAPGLDLGAYEEGPAVVMKLVDLLETAEVSLEQLGSLAAIRSNISDLDSNTESDWTAAQMKLESFWKELVGSKDWKPAIETALASEDRLTVWAAERAAAVLEIDLWEHFYQRVEDGHANWYQLMSTRHEERIKRAVDLACKLIPLNEIATGPKDLLALGPQYKAHGDLDYILQALRNWPGYGVELISAGLKSPSVRNRNMSLQALKEWGPQHWAPTTEDEIKNLLSVEPNEGTRELIQEVLRRRSPK